MDASRGPFRATNSVTLPSHGRAHNLSVVLQTLYSEGAMSRADLSRVLGLTRVTVSDLVSELLGRNHVVELGQSDKVRPGKPATLVDVNRRGLQIIGLDLAENSVLRGAVLDLDGNILHRTETVLSNERGEDVTQLVLALVRDTIAAATAPLLGIGAGSPGVVDADGRVLTAPNLAWTDVPLRDLLESESGLPALVANDADAAVLAEYTFGAGADDMILVKVGRGVGSGLMVNGQRARGVHSAAGEIGHVVVGTDGGLDCTCGKTGCLETWLSVPSLERGLTAAADAAEPQAAANAVLETAGERLAVALAPIAGALDLAEVVLSGPTHLLDGVLRASVERTLTARMLPQRPPQLTIRLAKEPQDVVLRGTAVMVLWNQLGVS
ncbi:ROK family protein [Zhihengliuella flava]|uniref:NBD/HSP70 family sugar kinase n=1 Tax=Zhihengliuella flava TaxID=1285193 RepID=A0A931DD27_9MICC|nr:ROK family protein [Zhihengliuella flava]MBG6084623.1 putative NBD/HSP70 family sugar kinase [Zhihengliuella flava]